MQFSMRVHSPRALIALLVSAATCSIVTGTLLAFLRTEGPVQLSQRTLTFEERVSYQRAIEEVYWRHRIWPKERRDPKPSLDAVMSHAQLERKAEELSTPITGVGGLLATVAYC